MMSNKARNPFKLRVSEKIENDSSFLRLFSPGALDFLYQYHKEGNLWENFVLLRSSPGAGKSSLLRIFEPSSLKFIWTHKTQDPYKDLFVWMKKLNAIDDYGVRMLSISIRCTRNYEILEDLEINKNQKSRLFYSLLNARIILAWLKGVCDLKPELSFPEDLDQLKVSYDPATVSIRSLPNPCNGADLYRWAIKIERDIDELLDSFIPSMPSVEGHDELYVLSILKPSNFSINNETFCDKVLITLDDSHKLSTEQRYSLIKYLSDNRSNTSIWMAERLESISNLRSYSDRDYINLENYWRDNQTKFKSILQKISQNRAAESTENVNSFEDHLLAEYDEEKYDVKLSRASDDIMHNIRKLTGFTNKYDEWVNELENLEGSNYEKALRRKQAEIIISRQTNKTQISFDFPHTISELYDKIDSSVEGAAKLFLCQETETPYYFGFKDLTLLSSNNIEQFLSFAAPTFEAMLSNEISGREVSLTDSEQQSIIQRVVKKKWDELRVLVPDADYIKRFLQSLGKYCREVTYKANAPYAPGINGFAITQRNRNFLIPENRWDENDLFEDLHEVLATCLAFNLLEVKVTKQGAKDQEWEVYYLNKWLCVKFDLPLTSGGWNKIEPDTLLKWTRKTT